MKRKTLHFKKTKYKGNRHDHATCIHQWVKAGTYKICHKCHLRINKYLHEF